MSLKIVSGVSSLRARRERRRKADDWLASATGTFVAPQYAWRAVELCSPRQRRVLARTLRHLLESATDRQAIRRVRPLPLVAVRQHRAAVRDLIVRLEAVHEPVTPAGMLRVGHLITDGASPLYGAARGDALGECIASTLDLLEPGPASRAA